MGGGLTSLHHQEGVLCCGESYATSTEHQTLQLQAYRERLGLTRKQLSVKWCYNTYRTLF